MVSCGARKLAREPFIACAHPPVGEWSRSVTSSAPRSVHGANNRLPKHLPSRAKAVTLELYCLTSSVHHQALRTCAYKRVRVVQCSDGGTAAVRR